MLLTDCRGLGRRAVLAFRTLLRGANVCCNQSACAFLGGGQETARVRM